MSEVQRYRRGPQSLVQGMIQAGVQAQIGDMMMLIGTYMVPANLLLVNSSGSGSGEGFSGGSGFTDFKSVFCGVLIEGATGGAETTDSKCLVDVGHDSEYEFDLPAALSQTYAPGQPLEPVVNSGSGSLYTQQLQVVTGRTYAVALLAKQAFSGDLTVRAHFFSTVMGESLT